MLSESYIITHYSMQEKVQIAKHSTQKALHTFSSFISLPNHPDALFSGHTGQFCVSWALHTFRTFAWTAASLLVPPGKILRTFKAQFEVPTDHTSRDDPLLLHLYC